MAIEKKNIFSSTAIWICLSVLLFDVLVAGIKPLQFIQIPGITFQDANLVADKIEAAFKLAKHRQNLMLGSSLLSEAVLSADLKDGVQPSDRELASYVKAECFDTRLADKTTTTSIGIAQAMLSDDYHIFVEYLKNGHKPKKLILLTAPRDFCDSTLPGPPDTRIDKYFKTLEKQRAYSHQEQFRQESEDALASVSSYFRVRGDYKTIVEFVTCALLNRQATLFSALQKTKDSIGNDLASVKIRVPWDGSNEDAKQQAANIKGYYELAYSSWKSPKTQEQIGYFHRLLSLCQKEGVAAVVVRMPLSEEFEALVPAELSTRLRFELPEASRKFGAQFIDFSNKPADFPRSSFSDGVHLNRQGSTVFWDRLVELVRSPASDLVN